MKKFLSKIYLPKFSKKEIIILGIIILIATFLRLYRIEDYLTFLGDEGRDVLIVKRMIIDHKFTLLGPTSSVGGFFLGPIYYYFMIPFLWLFQLNPVGPAIMVALFGIATVALLYIVAKDFFGTFGAVISSLLFALSPLVISYSRSSWNPNLMPFFSLSIMYLAYKTVNEKKNVYLLSIGILCGIIIQLHYVAGFLIIALAVYLAKARKTIQLNGVFKLGMGFLIGASLFLAFELKHGFPNTQTIIKFIFLSKETGFAENKFLFTLFDVFTRLFSHVLTNNNIPIMILAIAISTLPFLFLGGEYPKRKLGDEADKNVLAPTKSGIPWALAHGSSLAIKKNGKLKIYISNSNQLLLVWLIIGVAIFGLYKKGIYDYYFGFMYPLPFLLVSGGIVKLVNWNMIGKIVGGGIALILVYVNIIGFPFQYAPNRQLFQTKSVAKIIFDNAENQPLNLALVTGSNSDHAYRYFLEVWGNSPKVVENNQIDPERKSVTNQLFVICELQNCKPLGHPLWEIAGFGRAEIKDEWEIPPLKIYKLTHYQNSQ